MYHIRLKGTHYEIGHRWGAMLRQRGQRILDNVPFEITWERIDFARQCVPYYEKYFPSCLEEVNGIAAGQECVLERLTAVLFSMYCILPSPSNCSCFAARTDHGLIWGRNSDFVIEAETLCMNALYQFTDDAYSFNGNTTAFVEMEDGVNRHGLVIGLTSVAPGKIQPGLNAGLLLRLCLETCRTVGEVISRIRQVPIASSQTFIAADPAGNAALIECSPQGIEVCRVTEGKRHVCATNRFHTPKMAAYNNDPADDWRAGERYETMDRYLAHAAAGMDVPAAMDLLSGKQGFLCQYDRKTGKDTVWSVVYDTSDRSIYRAEGNPSRKAYQRDERRFCSA